MARKVKGQQVVLEEGKPEPENYKEFQKGYEEKVEIVLNKV